MGLVEKIQSVIEQEAEKFENSESLSGFEKASSDFDDLVKKGIAKKRGNNLMSIEGKHLQSYSLNY
jgi:hypothetical protein